MRDRVMTGLSLLYSVYSPLYLVDAFLLRALARRDKLMLVVLTCLLFLSLGLFGRMGVLVLSMFFVGYVALQDIWTRMAKRYYSYGSVAAYPIHPALRPQVTRLTGYRPKGTRLYEIHIDPQLLRRVTNGVQAGVMVLHDAKRFTTKLRDQETSVSVIGTTYEARLAQTATFGARKNLRETVHKSETCPLGSKVLYPKKQWDTFVWEI